MNKKYVDSQKLLSNQPINCFLLINKDYLSEKVNSSIDILFGYLNILMNFANFSTKKSLFILENSLFLRRFSTNKGNRN